MHTPAAKKNPSRNKSKYSVAKKIRNTGLSRAADIERRIKIEDARKKLQAERLKREIAEIRTPDSLPTSVNTPIKVVDYESTKIITSTEPQPRPTAICHKCDGTGANGGCNICDGSGFVKGNSVAPVGSSTWKLDEGIAGSREDNKKMRGQLRGDMRKRGR